MANTPEGRVKDAIKAVLKEHHVYYFMPVQNGMGKPGLDFHCIHFMIGFTIEAKAPGKKPTARQEVTIEEVRGASGIVFVIDQPEGPDMDRLKEFLSMCQSMFWDHLSDWQEDEDQFEVERSAKRIHG